MKIVHINSTFNLSTGKIALSICNLANKQKGSNNVKDVSDIAYLDHIDWLTSGKVLKKAVTDAVITDEEAEEVWKEMKKVQELPCDTFAEYKEKRGAF